jgi:hypothetical protein
MSLDLKYSMIGGIVSSGVLVGTEIRSRISPFSLPTAQSILVPPASNVPYSIVVFSPAFISECNFPFYPFSHGFITVFILAEDSETRTVFAENFMHLGPFF